MLDDRPADNRPKLVLAIGNRGFGYVARFDASSPAGSARTVNKAITRIEIVIAQEFEGRAVKAVSTGFGDYIDDAAGSAAIF